MIIRLHQKGTDWKRVVRDYMFYHHEAGEIVHVDVMMKDLRDLGLKPDYPELLEAMHALEKEGFAHLH